MITKQKNNIHCSLSTTTIQINQLKLMKAKGKFWNNNNLMFPLCSHKNKCLYIQNIEQKKNNNLILSKKAFRCD